MPGKLQRVRIQAQEPGQDNPVVQFNNIKFIRNPWEPIGRKDPAIKIPWPDK